MKQILHIIRISQFTAGFVRAIKKQCGNYKHVFWIYYVGLLTGDEEYLYEDNVQYISSFAHELRKPHIEIWFDTFDKIIYHGLFEHDIISFFADHNNLLSKLYLYFWGGDIPIDESINEAKTKIIRNAAGLITIIESDYEKLCTLYNLDNPQSIHMAVMYGDEKEIGLTKKILAPKLFDSKDKIYIQVGNSATETNEHIKVLNMLKKFREENICIILPLAYGDKEYAKKVAECGRKIFGDKIVILRDYLPLEEYIEQYLSKVDIGIFAMARQQALGNIMMLCASGTKLYLKRNAQLDHYMTKERKCKIYYIDDIEDLSFSEFASMSLKIKKDNSNKILDYYDSTAKMEKWNELFEL